MDEYVIAINGNIYPKEQCKERYGVYYVINLHCFYMDERWRYIDSNDIVYLRDEKRYELLIKLVNSHEYAETVIDDEFNIGWKKISPIDSVLVLFDKIDQIYPVHINNVPDGYVMNNLSDFYSEEKFQNKSYQKEFSLIEKRSLNYGANEHNHMFRNISEVYNEYIKTFNVPDVFKTFARFLHFSFGIEYETIKGIAPMNELYKNGLVPLRDGSIEGIEYTTIPLEGEYGLYATYHGAKLLQSRCVVDRYCALHIHYGLADLSTRERQEMAVRLWKIYYDVRQELIDMNVPYRRSEDFLGEKEKDHCAPLPILATVKNPINSEAEMNDAIDDMCQWLTGYDWYELKREYGGCHPNSSQAKWYSGQRYLEFNVLPALYSRGQTFEFRIHAGTVNVDKVLPWLFICNAIMSYGMYYDSVLTKKSKLTLDQVLSKYITNFGQEEYLKEGEALYKYLSEYVKYRKDEFKDNDGLNDFTNDQKYLYPNIIDTWGIETEMQDIGGKENVSN